MRRAARVDANQEQIVSALRAAGAYVWIIGLPVDLLVGFRGHTFLVEIKSTSKKRLTGLQADFFEKMPVESPNIRFIGFGDASIQVNVALRVSQFEFKVEIRHEFIKRMHKVFATEGIFLPLPLRDTPPVTKSAEPVE
jgi:small-conductance mechanosensitive channel